MSCSGGFVEEVSKDVQPTLEGTAGVGSRQLSCRDGFDFPTRMSSTCLSLVPCGACVRDNMFRLIRMS